MVKKYIKKSVAVALEAVQWTGHNFDEIQEFVGHENVTFMRKTDPPKIYIITEHQVLHRWIGFLVSLGDYIVRNSHNKFDIYTKSRFEQLFEEANQ